MSRPAVEIDHAAYARKVLTMSEDALRYTINDCREAIAALPDGHKAGVYADEIAYCSGELARRANISKTARDAARNKPTGKLFNVIAHIRTHELNEELYVATVVEVSDESAALSEARAVFAFDCDDHTILSMKADFVQKGRVVSL